MRFGRPPGDAARQSAKPARHGLDDLVNIAVRPASYYGFEPGAHQPMNITHADVERVARDLGRVLELFDRLAAIDTREVEPLSHPLGATQRLRPDLVTEEVDRAALRRRIRHDVDRRAPPGTARNRARD